MNQLLQSEEFGYNKTILSLFSGCGGMDIGFEGGFIALKRSVDLNLHRDWIEEDFDDFVNSDLTVRGYIQMIIKSGRCRISRF